MLIHDCNSISRYDRSVQARHDVRLERAQQRPLARGALQTDETAAQHVCFQELRGKALERNRLRVRTKARREDEPHRLSGEGECARSETEHDR